VVDVGDGLPGPLDRQRRHRANAARTELATLRPWPGRTEAAQHHVALARVRAPQATLVRLPLR
jgi:hypothetical protein